MAIRRFANLPFQGGKSMPTRDLTFAIVGSGGDGVITVGDMMAQAGASRCG
jgi:hypothetical protein